jgi:hypothetical protein
MDKVRCPYCGAEMSRTGRYYDDYEAYWYEYFDCEAESPVGETPQDAYAAAMRRWQEPRDADQ